MDMVTPNYSYVFDFENEFIHQDTRKWMIKNWTWVFYYCGVYMLIIFGGQFWMQNRPRWEFGHIPCVHITYSLDFFKWNSTELLGNFASLPLVSYSFMHLSSIMFGWVSRTNKCLLCVWERDRERIVFWEYHGTIIKPLIFPCKQTNQTKQMDKQIA